MPLPKRYDRAYKAHDGQTDAVYEVNLARFQCTCPEWEHSRVGFPPGDVRRVCAHIYDKLLSTKLERTFDPILQLFIRYGRSMLSCHVLADELGVFIVGQPFGPRVIRAIGVLNGKPVLATYNFDLGEWSRGETDLSANLAGQILERMRSAFPAAVGG